MRRELNALVRDKELLFLTKDRDRGFVAHPTPHWHQPHPPATHSHDNYIILPVVLCQASKWTHTQRTVWV